MTKRGPRTAVKETVNAQAEALLALGGFRARDGTVLIAEVGPDVVGVAVLRLCDGEAEVLALLTAPNHRHRGVARALVHEMSKRAKAAGCQRLRVRVDKARDDVPAFFRALGFDESQLALDLRL